MKKTIQRRFNGKTRPSQDELNERMDEAAAKGNADEVDALLKQGADVNARDADGWTPLHRAAWNDHAETVSALIERGADMEARDRDGWTPLHMAAGFGHTGTVKALILRGADLDAKEGRGRTPLYLAASGGPAELIAAQIAGRAEGRKAGFLHDHVGGEGVAGLLAMRGADENIKDAHGQTPLDIAETLNRRGTAHAIREGISLRHAQRAKALAAARRGVPL